jgi:methionine synthase I (cobalamin-dependent)
MTFDPTVKLTRQNIAYLPPMTTDGAWGTEMQKVGAEPGQMCDHWNVDEPDRVLKVARNYIKAGSQVILTNTFSSNRFVLKDHGMEEREEELCEAGARLSKQAAEGKAYVFASIGPTGKMVSMGDLESAQVEDSAGAQAMAHERGGADALVIETQADPEEAAALLRGATGASSLPVGISFTFDHGENNDRTMFGVTVEQAADIAHDGGAAFVGANCGAGIHTIPHIAELFQACSGEMPIWIKGNAGLPEAGPNGETLYRGSPQMFREAVPALLDAGVTFIGGCCGSGPEHVAAIRQAMNAELD